MAGSDAVIFHFLSFFHVYFLFIWYIKVVLGISFNDQRLNLQKVKNPCCTIILHFLNFH